MHQALLAALPYAAISAKRYDHLDAGFTGVDELPEAVRELVLVEEEELEAMARSELVSGHFALPTLVRIAPPDSIATILREPRTRLLSLYAFWRLTPDWDDQAVHTDRLYDQGLRPLDEYLSEPEIASAVDNVVCRMLLHGDHRLPGDGFISAEHIEGLASDAIDWLDQFGFVGVLECREAMWDGLSRFFGVTLKPTRFNVTASNGIAAGSLPIQEPISARTFDLLNARTAADALVYRHALMADLTEAEAKQIGDAAFAAQLVRLGDLAGSSAASAQSLTRRVAESESQIASLTEQLRRREEELARHSVWLEGIQASVSWRITSPLRAAKRRVFTAKPSSSASINSRSPRRARGDGDGSNSH